MTQIAAAEKPMSESGWPEIEVVRQIRDGALLLGDYGEDHTAVLILRRVEVLLLMRALMKRHDLVCPEHYLSEEDWKTAQQVVAIGAFLSSLTVEEAEALKTALGPAAELSLVHSDRRQRRSLARALRRAAHQLSIPFDSDSHRIDRLRFYRWARIGAIAAIALFLLGIVTVKLLNNQLSSNIALHRPVTVSSTLAGYERAKGAQLVDGNTADLAFHTNYEANPFVVIDLGESKSFRKVVVYNRHDCCQDRAVPLLIEVSDDGQTYYAVDERRESFEQWVADRRRAKGRYVRLRVEKSDYFHLTEVKIY
jgi:hypothetical protein